MTAALLALLLAIPAEARLSLHAGEHRIERIDPADVVETEGPLRAELLPGGNELLLEPSAKGVARAFLFTRRQVRVIEIFVDTEPPPPAATPACPIVKDAVCYGQFRRAPQPKMVLELDGVQAEAKAAQEELTRAGLGHIAVALSAWGVKLRGAKDEPERRRALRAIWPAILGPLRFDL